MLQSCYLTVCYKKKKKKEKETDHCGKMITILWAGSKIFLAALTSVSHEPTWSSSTEVLIKTCWFYFSVRGHLERSICTWDHVIFFCHCDPWLTNAMGTFSYKFNVHRDQYIQDIYVFYPKSFLEDALEFCVYSVSSYK